MEQVLEAVHLPVASRHLCFKLLDSRILPLDLLLRHSLHLMKQRYLLVLAADFTLCYP